MRNLCHWRCFIPSGQTSVIITSLIFAEASIQASGFSTLLKANGNKVDLPAWCLFTLSSHKGKRNLGWLFMNYVSSSEVIVPEYKITLLTDCFVWQWYFRDLFLKEKENKQSFDTSHLKASMVYINFLNIGNTIPIACSAENCSSML